MAVLGLTDFRLEVHLAKWEFAARWHMTASDAEPLTLRELLALANPEDLARWENLSLGYVETHGTERLRTAIAATYDTRKPEDILCFAGAEEGIFCVMHALLSPDDHAVVLTPGYQSSEELPRSLCAVSGVPLRPEHDWELDVDDLASAMRPNTKLVAINFPHNPTGKIVSRATLDALVHACRARGIWLFSDEVYRGLELDAGHRLPAVVDVYERGLSLGVMSKAYGLAGLRVGWIASHDHALLSRMGRMKHYLSICNAAPSEHLAVIALKARDAILERHRALLRTNLVATEAFMAEHSGHFEWRRPEGGCVAYPRYLGAEGVETLCERLVAEEGLVLLPASIFRSALTNAPSDHFRIGFGRRHTTAGLNVMSCWLRERASAHRPTY